MYRVKLRRIREAKGMSQTELADKVGIAVSMVSMVENGVRSLNVPMFKLWYKALGVTADEVLEEE